MFTDTKPLEASGLIAPYDLASYPSWDGAEFDAVQLTVLGTAYNTPGSGPPTIPSIASLFPNMTPFDLPWLGSVLPARQAT